MPSPRADALTGSFLAFAVGDALGWPMEGRGKRVGGTKDLKPELTFHQWRRREGGRYAPREETIPAGAYSDDTQLTLAVARSLRADDWWAHWTRTELPWWNQYQMGGGGATRRAAQAWTKGQTPWQGPDAAKYWQAGGNGVAMRVLAHAASDDFEAARDRVLADGAATHGHPIALVSAQAYAFALWLTLRRPEPLGWGQLLDEVLDGVAIWAQIIPEVVPHGWSDRLPDDYAEEWARTVDQFTDLLRLARSELAHGALALDDRVLDKLGCFSAQSGAGTITVAGALYLASRHASDPRQGLLRAAFARGADTDTLAAMTGGLLGALHGLDWLGSVAQEVMDAELLHRSAELLDRPLEKALAPFDRRALRHVEAELARAHPGAQVKVPFYGEVTVHEIRDLDNRTVRIRSWWMRNAEGQTFRIVKTSKAERSPWVTLKPPQADRAGAAVAGAEKAAKAGTSMPAEAGTGEPEGAGSGKSAKTGSDKADTTKTSTTEANGSAPQVRSGLVVHVTDLDQSREFYETVIGMPVSRTNRSGLTLGGWLALEPGGLGGHSSAGISIPFAVTLYAGGAAIAAAENRLKQAGVPYTISDTERGRALRTHDPDGIPVDICPHALT